MAAATKDDAPPDSVEALAAEEPEEKPVPPMQIPLPGTENLISDRAGGANPTSSEARLLGGSLPIEGQFAKGDVVTLIVEAKVGSIEVVDATDDWGNVTNTKRRHKMRMLSVKRA